MIILKDGKGRSLRIEKNIINDFSTSRFNIHRSAEVYAEVKIFMAELALSGLTEKSETMMAAKNICDVLEFKKDILLTLRDDVSYARVLK